MEKKMKINKFIVFIISIIFIIGITFSSYATDIDNPDVGGGTNSETPVDNSDNNNENTNDNNNNNNDENNTTNENEQSNNQGANPTENENGNQSEQPIEDENPTNNKLENLEYCTITTQRKNLHKINQNLQRIQIDQYITHILHQLILKQENYLIMQI